MGGYVVNEGLLQVAHWRDDSEKRLEPQGGRFNAQRLVRLGPHMCMPVWARRQGAQHLPWQEPHGHVWVVRLKQVDTIMLKHGGWIRVFVHDDGIATTFVAQCRGNNGTDFIAQQAWQHSVRQQPVRPVLEIQKVVHFQCQVVFQIHKIVIVIQLLHHQVTMHCR